MSLVLQILLLCTQKREKKKKRKLHKVCKTASTPIKSDPQPLPVSVTFINDSNKMNKNPGMIYSMKQSQGNMVPNSKRPLGKKIRNIFLVTES